MDTSRRESLKGLAALGLGLAAPVLWAQPKLETTRVRIAKFASVCQAPVYLAGELLRAEGFTDVSYIDVGVPGIRTLTALGEGKTDIEVNFAAPLSIGIDRGAPVTVLGGVHPGCFELFTSLDVRGVKDLKGKTISVPGNESVQHTFLASIATSVGLDPAKDINWVFHPPPQGKQLLAEGKIDGYLGFPPDPQELRDKKVGKMLLSSTVDRPWSQYYCCLAVANRDWLQKHPVAAKAVLRALLKASDLCAADPGRALEAYTAMGFSPNAKFAEQALRELPYRRWSDLNPEETLRFYSLRLREAGMVKGTPQKIIADGTDWRMWNELRRELKS